MDIPEAAMFFDARILKPAYPAAIVDRPRLYRHLDRWPELRAIAINAPAGYGKSSLVSRWLDVSGAAGRSAWLSLDESDGDPRQFARAVSVALATLLPDLPAAIQPVLDAPQGDPQRAMARLIATLWERLGPGSSAPDHGLLVLDDLHLVAASEAMAPLKSLLEKGPPRLHVMLLTRSTASLPLSRLRLDGQVIELAVADLRLSAEEADQYLSLRQIPCSAGELQQIMDRTEGWVAALQLAVYSQRNHGTLAEYLGALRGDSRWLAHFLTQEVLAQQSPAMRTFLLRTSILDAFCAPLCEAVAGIDDAYQMLAELQHSELFLVQLDAAGAWFRYHHLFQEFLQQRLLADEGKAAVDRLHRRAAAWLASQQQLLPAIHHLRAAGDDDGAVALVESRLRPLTLQDPVRAQRLADALPPDAVARRPRLMLERCLISIMMVYKDLARHVRNAQRALAAYPPAEPQRQVLETELLLYRTCAHFAEGELEEAAALGKEALRQNQHLDPFLQGTLEFLWMRLSARSADETIPRRHASRALAAFTAVNHVDGLIAVRRELAMLDVRAGRSAEASREFARIAASFGHDPATLRAELIWLYVYAAEHCYWQDQLGEAQRYLQAAEEVATVFQDDDMARCLPYLSRLYASKTERSGAVDAPDPLLEAPPLGYPFVDWQIRWLLAEDRAGDAWEVAREYQAGLADDLRTLAYRLAVPYLRAVVARGVDLAEARSLLDQTLERAVASRDYPRQLDLLALRAWQELQTGQADTARRTVAEAEALAARTGYVRVLLDIPSLAALTPGEQPEAAGVVTAQAEGGRLLTEQEQAVLALLAGHRTYTQIAEELVISINTVRTHVRHIYKKLGVHRRDQAVQRAQESGQVR